VAQIFIGTSGFFYRHWRGILYPPGLPPERWLGRYAEVFPTVEVNNTLTTWADTRFRMRWS